MTYSDDLQQKSILKGYNMLLFFAGTMIMYEPSEECITDFWTKGILKMLPVSSSNPTFLKASALLREACDDKSFCTKKLHEDYTRLFSESDNALAPVYESRNRYTGLPELKNRISDVTEFYNSYGWISKFKNKVNDDHLSVELLFLTRLIDKYLDLDDDACRNEMKNEIRRFITEHLFSWINEWNNKIQLHSTTLSYRGIGTLVVACTQDIYSLLDRDYRITFTLNDLKN
jgi:TorA maturation chaperone TorD